MLFNKAAGFYGLLALLTGFALNATQLSLYIYSVLSLILTAYLIRHVRRQSPLECLGLAWFYLLDTCINCAFTAMFAVAWFLTVSTTHSNAPGSGTIADTAGFTSPTHNVSEVEIMASPATGLTGGQDAAAVGIAAPAAAAAQDPNLQLGVGISEGILSLVIIVVLTLIRVYFILVVMAYARQVLRQYKETPSIAPSRQQKRTEVENPFSDDMPEGQGWRGRLGRIMVSLGKGYFLGGAVDESRCE